MASTTPKEKKECWGTGSGARVLAVYGQATDDETRRDKTRDRLMGDD